MFTKDQIRLEHLSPLLKQSSYTDFNTLQTTLCEIANQIISTLNITSLSHINIKNMNLFEKEAGVAHTQIINGQMQSYIDLSYKIFANIYFNQNHTWIENHNNAVATVWHEFYHIYDHEQRYSYVDCPSDITPLDNYYYEIGTKYWSEFYANYKTFQYYEANYKYDMLKEDYELFRHNSMASQDQYIILQKFHNLLYILNSVLGYYYNDNHSNKCEKSLALVSNQSFIEDIKTQLLYIVSKYPNTIGFMDFVKLGKIYYSILSFEVFIEDGGLRFKDKPQDYTKLSPDEYITKFNRT